MNDDRTLKFAVDGFCSSSRTRHVYKNTLPNWRLFGLSLHLFVSLLKFFTVRRLGRKEGTVVFVPQLA